VSLDTKASKLKVILNGCLANKIKVFLDTTGNKNKTSQWPRDEHSLYGVRLMYPHRVLG